MGSLVESDEDQEDYVIVIFPKKEGYSELYWDDELGQFGKTGTVYRGLHTVKDAMRGLRTVRDAMNCIPNVYYLQDYSDPYYEKFSLEKKEKKQKVKKKGK